MPRLLISYLILTVVALSSPFSHALASEGTNERCLFQIDFKDAYLSGICIMRADEQMVTASVVNEFGVSALTFVYDVQKRKVKIIDIVKPLNRLSIKSMLRSDLKVIMADLYDKNLSIKQRYEYRNKKHKILYTFKPIADEITR